MTHDPLREAFRALQSEGSSACPTGDELAALVLGEVASPRRAELADHVIGCRRCSEDAAILYETHREVQGRQALGAPTRRRYFALVAAAAALAVIGLLVARQPRRMESTERGLAAKTVGLIPADGAQLLEPPVRFAWPSHPQAEAYRLRLFRDSGDALWESPRITAPATEVPPDSRGLLEAGSSYFWTVEVVGPVETTRLGPFTFHIAPPAPR